MAVGSHINKLDIVGVQTQTHTHTYLYLMYAQVGSMFEFANKNAIFGVVQPDNFLWAPILGLFALTGIPTSGMLDCVDAGRVVVLGAWLCWVHGCAQ